MLKDRDRKGRVGKADEVEYHLGGGCLPSRNPREDSAVCLGKRWGKRLERLPTLLVCQTGAEVVDLAGDPTKPALSPTNTLLARGETTEPESFYVESHSHSASALR